MKCFDSDIKPPEKNKKMDALVLLLNQLFSPI